MQAGYPESEATWQFANTLDDCAALDVWQQAKLETRAAAAEVEELQESLTRAITNASTRPDADGFATAGADPARLNGGTPAVFAQSQAITDSFRDHAV
jgi:hypothetical protein